MHRTERAARVKRDLAKLKTVFPECNEMVYSICSRPHETGATWTRLARETMGHTDAHRLKHSLKVRVTESRYNEVKELIEAEGKFPTVNAWLDWWVWVYVESHRRARKSEDTISILIDNAKKDPPGATNAEQVKWEADSRHLPSDNTTNL